MSELESELELSGAAARWPREVRYGSEAWLAAFAAQCTGQLYEDARRFARRRAAGVAKAGGSGDDFYVRAVVQDVLSDTATGTLRWNPVTERLADHVWDAIRTKTDHDRRRALRYRHESIDGDDPENEPGIVGEVEAALEENAAAEREEAGWTAERLAALRSAAVGQIDVERFIDALAMGAASKAEVMEKTGMTEEAYHVARTRVGRLGRQLATSATRARKGSR